MTVLSGQTIRKLKIFKPFHERTQHLGLTHGLGPAGYDVRIEFDADGSTDAKLVEPGGFLLASTIEHFTMPTNTVGYVKDKSTWARRGLFVQNTVIEPGWRGFLTLEITNSSDKSIWLVKGMPIAQIVFHFTDEPVELSYSGKYHDQERGPVNAR